MNPILIDFEKLFATIKNEKNNLSHLPGILKMIQLFEKKYKRKYTTSTKLLVEYLEYNFKLLKIQLHLFDNDKKI